MSGVRRVLGTCTHVGCEEPAVARSLCNPHYKQAKRKGNLPEKLDPEQASIERFWANVEKSDGCWQWIGSISVYGYGQFGTRSGSKRAHRMSYELIVGKIPAGKVLDHLCRNRACVNPQHLEPVTSRENILRGTGPSANNAKKETCKAGHPLELDYGNGRNCKPCSLERSSKHGRTKRDAKPCGELTSRGKQCKRKVAKDKVCAYHAPARVLDLPEVNNGL